MKRHSLVLLAILFAGTLGFSKDRDRPRRNPSSAKPPPPDWKALVENGERDVRALLVPWLEARTEIAEYRIREVRVLGDIAYAMVEVRRAPAERASEWLPDVSTWRRFKPPLEVEDGSLGLQYGSQASTAGPPEAEADPPAGSPRHPPSDRAARRLQAFG